MSEHGLARDAQSGGRLPFYRARVACTINVVSNERRRLSQPLKGLEQTRIQRFFDSINFTPNKYIDNRDTLYSRSIKGSKFRADFRARKTYRRL